MGHRSNGLIECKYSELNPISKRIGYGFGFCTRWFACFGQWYFFHIENVAWLVIFWERTMADIAHGFGVGFFGEQRQCFAQILVFSLGDDEPLVNVRFGGNS